MRIVVSNTARGAYKGVLEFLKKNVRTGAENIVIAPDRFTASVERGLLDSLGVECTTDVDVMSFTRLADKVLGDGIKKCLTPEGSVMLLGRVIRELKGELIYYKKAVETEGFATELYAAVTAIRNSGISGETLNKYTDKLPVSLRAKTRDIALIYGGYLKALGDRHSDSTTRLAALADFLLRGEPFAAHVYVIDFYGFKEPEYAILKGLATSALSLTIGTVDGENFPNKRIYFGGIIKRLKRLTEDKCEIDVRNEELHPALDCISKYLFSYESVDKRVECDGKVLIRSARNRSEEVLKLAVDIIEKVRAGARYKDFEVFLSDVELYTGEIKRVFTRYGIPFFIDKRERLEEQTKARYLLSALAAVSEDFKADDVFDFVKNPLFINRIDKLIQTDAENETAVTANGADAVFAFENYALKYNANYSRFKSAFIFDDGSDDVYAAELVRGELNIALQPFSAAGTNPAGEFVKASYEFCAASDEAWAEYVDGLESIGAYYKKCAEQVDLKLASALDEINGISDFATDVEGFYKILRDMLKTLKISLVPTLLDCVFFGDGDSRFLGGGDLYVFGANYGLLPGAAGGGAVITGKDEELLSAVGIEIVPGCKGKLYLKMLAVLEAMKKPHGRLIVSYSETSPSGALRPSTVVAELKGMLLQDGEQIKEERINFDCVRPSGDGCAEGNVRTLFSTPDACIYEIMKNAVTGRAPAEDLDVYRSAYAFCGDKDKKRLEKTMNIPERIEARAAVTTTSVSRLERFFVCPYSYYFNYVIKLKKRSDGDAEGTENGIVLHRVLERFFTALKDGTVTPENIENDAYGYFDAAVEEFGFGRLLKKPETMRMLNRLRNESAKTCAELYSIYLRSEFKPFLLEAGIGDGNIKPVEIDLNGKTVSLTGRIDRIDKCGENFIVIDYKAYKSAGLSLNEIYYGEKLQLYVYMKAVRDSLGLTPKGVFYLPVFSSFTQDGVNRFKYRGQVSDDREYMEKIDSAFAESPAESAVPYKASKKGVPSADVHLSDEGFGKISDYVYSLAVEGVKLISDGYVKPSPLKDACDFCRFSEICAYKETNVRRKGKVTAAAFGIAGEGANE